MTPPLTDTVVLLASTSGRRHAGRLVAGERAIHLSSEMCIPPAAGSSLPLPEAGEVVPSPPPGPDQAVTRPRRRFLFGVPGPRTDLALIAVVVLVLGIWAEIRTSWLQSAALARLTSSISWTASDSSSEGAAMLPAPTGPYDQRLGYTRIPVFRERLAEYPYELESHAVASPALERLIDWGLYPIYREKDQAGLQVLGQEGELMFRARYPDNLFASFDDIPALVRDALLWIENRELLDPYSPTSNPAIEWTRISGALAGYALSNVGVAPSSTGGGSTLATQIEKFRHSPGGVTRSPTDKLRQIASASARAYVDGRDTRGARRGIVTDYVNSVPLAAIRGYGEVNGLGNGLWAWYGLDMDEVFRALRVEDESASTEALAEKAHGFRAVLSLFVAQRRPTYYLARAQGREDLDELVDAHVRLLARDGVISEPLRVASLEARGSMNLHAHAPAPPPISFIHQKASHAVRAELLEVLDIERLYELDRLDLTVESTISVPTQAAVSAELERLHDPEYARAIGLTAPRLLESGDPSRVYYSLLLLERTPRGNLVRVQTDNFPGPFDVNRASKLELGSTAKLRTLVTYLEVIATVHADLSPLTAAGRDSAVVVLDDPLTRWTVSHLAADADATLAETLEAAMTRTYSANPAETFFTGGGTHRFSNFDDTYDHRAITVTEAFRQSVNLVFVRMMRDIVRYHTLRVPGSTARVLEDPADPARMEYLQRFADTEGRTFIARFHARYRAVDPDSLLSTFLDGRRRAPQRLAWAYRAVRPVGTTEELAEVLATLDPDAPVSPATVVDMFRRADASAQNLPDLGYLAGVHPLEIWLVRHLLEHPGASLGEIVEASAAARQEVYRWLFRANTRAQDQRIRSMLEVEAFLEIGRTWRRLGYPFANLVPSLGTSIGSSGDRPLALADLAGILVADGVRSAPASIERLRFAEGTPYEASFGREPGGGEQVLPAEVARVAAAALLDVVENGTGRRARGAIVTADGQPLAIGGKTGTGDNRRYTRAVDSGVTTSTIVNRTAAFVFHIEGRYFGVVTAFVEGAEAAQYRFTSALPVQVFRQLSPALTPLVTGAP
jgi:membrane peptidoglycan carboxypeptidase